MITVGELDAVRTFLGQYSAPQLRQLARTLWPAAAIGEAGPLSLLALELLDDELVTGTVALKDVA